MKNKVITLLIIGFVLVILAVTNPSMSEYKSMVTEKLFEGSIQTEELLKYADFSLERDNYIFLSVYKTDDGYVTIGAFGNFFTLPSN